ncbi:hypothetical protein D3C71_1735640 [compost metagenome]
MCGGSGITCTHSGLGWIVGVVNAVHAEQAQAAVGVQSRDVRGWDLGGGRCSWCRCCSCCRRYRLAWLVVQQGVAAACAIGDALQASVFVVVVLLAAAKGVDEADEAAGTSRLDLEEPDGAAGLGGCQDVAGVCFGGCGDVGPALLMVPGQ